MHIVGFVTYDIIKGSTDFQSWVFCLFVCVWDLIHDCHAEIHYNKSFCCEIMHWGQNNDFSSCKNGYFAVKFDFLYGWLGACPKWTLGELQLLHWLHSKLAIFFNMFHNWSVSVFAQETNPEKIQLGGRDVSQICVKWKFEAWKSKQSSFDVLSNHMLDFQVIVCIIQRCIMVWLFAFGVPNSDFKATLKQTNPNQKHVIYFISWLSSAYFSLLCCDPMLYK